MYCFVEDDDLLEQYNSIWDKHFASEVFYNKKFFENQKKISQWWSYRFMVKEFLRWGLIILL